MNKRRLGCWFIAFFVSLQFAACKKVSRTDKHADGGEPSAEELHGTDSSKDGLSTDGVPGGTDTGDSSFSTDSVPGGTDTESDLLFTAEEYAAFGRALCGYYERCSPSLLLSFKGGTYKGCVEVFECISTSASRLSTSPYIANYTTEECMQHLENVDCGVGVDLDVLMESPCMYYEILAEGEACGLIPDRNRECEKGTHCAVVDPDDSDAVCGVCVRNQGINEMCDWSVPCDEGLYCSENFECKLSKKLGEPCESNMECTSSQCVVKRCAEPRKLGDNCNDSVGLNCVVGLACFEGKCSAPEGDLGGDCDLTKGCRMGLSCIKGRCEALECSPADIGEACDPNSYQCGVNARCSRSSLTCVPLREQGEPCDDTEMNCANGLFCDHNSLTCLPKKGNGETCVSSDECQSWYCRSDQNVCAEGLGC